jgi:hypothetical protein
MSSQEISRRQALKLTAELLGGAAVAVPVSALLGNTFLKYVLAEEGSPKPTATKTTSEPKATSTAELTATATSASEQKPTATAELPTPTPQATAVPTETLVPIPTPTLETSASLDLNRIETGVEFLDAFGLRRKVIYIVYGRPNKDGEPTWGSLGVRTAEESWNYYRRLRRAISQEIGKSEEDFALNIINPVYRSVNGTIKDIYIDKALELAPQNKGLVALNFNNTEDAYNTIARLETIFPKERLTYLAVGLDVEHFPGHVVEARVINEFSAWFSQKHRAWAEGRRVPGVVLVYTFHGQSVGRILHLNELTQYYPQQGTFVPLVFDGYGTLSGKRAVIGQILEPLPDSENFPAVLGPMEFKSRWGRRYDDCTIAETFSLTEGAEISILATQ